MYVATVFHGCVLSLLLLVKHNSRIFNRRHDGSKFRMCRAKIYFSVAFIAADQAWCALIYHIVK